MLPFPKTPAQFRRQAEAGFRRANPDATGLTIEWEFARRVTFPTGLKGFSGIFRASADGFRTRENVIASATPETGLSVR